MLNQKTKLATSVFSAGILTTFGKLSHDDIDTIDGNPEQLVAQLIEQYGWKPDAAGHKVEVFLAGLSGESEYSEMTSNEGVES